MRIDYQFTVTLAVDAKQAEMLHGENWLPAYQESAREFAQELNAFLDAHPFVKACKMKEEVSNA
jgi:hypothetical protein